MRNSTISSDHGPAPMCADPLTAHGNPTTTQHTHRKIPSFQQKPAPHPAEAPPSHVQHQRQPHPKHAPTTPLAEIGPLPARDRSNSARPTRRRSTHDKLRGQNHMPHLGNHRRTADPRKHDRSRRETQPISARVTTDLDASFDRSRGGTGPISARVTTDLEPECDRSRRRGRLGGPKKRGTRQASTDRWTPPSLGRLSQVSYLVHKIETRGTFSCDPDQQPH